MYHKNIRSHSWSVFQFEKFCTDSSPSIFITQLNKEGIPKPSEQKVGKIPRVANSSRNHIPPVHFVDFVGLRDVVLLFGPAALIWAVTGREGIVI